MFLTLAKFGEIDGSREVVVFRIQPCTERSALACRVCCWVDGRACTELGKCEEEGYIEIHCAFCRDLSLFIDEENGVWFLIERNSCFI